MMYLYRAHTWVRPYNLMIFNHLHQPLQIKILGLHRDFGLLVEGQTGRVMLAHEFQQLLLRLAAGQGTLVPRMEHAIDGGCGTDAHKDGQTVLVHPFHVVEIAGRAAARGNHRVFKVFRFLQHLRLQFAVERLVVFLEKIVDGNAVFFLKQGIRVGHFPTEAVGQAFGGGSFARTHVANEIDSIQELRFKDLKFKIQRFKIQCSLGPAII